MLIVAVCVLVIIGFIVSIVSVISWGLLIGIDELFFPGNSYKIERLISKMLAIGIFSASLSGLLCVFGIGLVVLYRWGII